MYYPDQIKKLGQALEEQEMLLGTAESCTGGFIGHLLTNQPGSSGWYAGGVVVYSNALKMNLLKVQEKIIQEKGAVSRECVMAMAAGVSELTGADAALAVSGIAGPGGGTPDKPVGTVFIAWKLPDKIWAAKKIFAGNRLEIKFQTAVSAINILFHELNAE